MVWTYWMIIGAAFGILAVALDQWTTPTFADSIKERSYGLAMRHLFIHALMIMILGLVSTRLESSFLILSGIAFTIGTIFFSGGALLRQMIDRPWLALIHKIGSGVLIFGWLAFIIGIFFLGKF